MIYCVTHSEALYLLQLGDSNQARLAKPYVSMTVKRPLETVTCFKVSEFLYYITLHPLSLSLSFQCGEKGHYANTVSPMVYTLQVFKH